MGGLKTQVRTIVGVPRAQSRSQAYIITTTVRFSDMLNTKILYSRVFDTPNMFIPLRLNDCLGMGRNGN